MHAVRASGYVAHRRQRWLESTRSQGRLSHQQDAQQILIAAKQRSWQATRPAGEVGSVLVSAARHEMRSLNADRRAEAAAADSPSVGNALRALHTRSSPERHELIPGQRTNDHERRRPRPRHRASTAPNRLTGEAPSRHATGQGRTLATVSCETERLAAAADGPARPTAIAVDAESELPRLSAAGLQAEKCCEHLPGRQSGSRICVWRHRRRSSSRERPSARRLPHACTARRAPRGRAAYPT